MSTNWKTGVLIVLALAGIGFCLWPSYGGERVASPKVICLSKVKIQGTCLLIYSSDFDDRLPVGTGNGVGWAEVLMPYVKNANEFICPLDASAGDRNAPPNTPQVISYAMNSNVAGGNLAPYENPAKTVLAFEVAGGKAYLSEGFNGIGVSPAGSGIIGDLHGGAGDKLSYATGPLDNGQMVGVFGSGVDARHDSFSVVSAVDSHAKSVRANKISAGLPAKSAKSGQSPTGCRKSKTSEPIYPCAEGTAASGHQFTFSPI